MKFFIILLFVPGFVIARPYKKVPVSPYKIEKVSFSNPKFKEQNGYLRCTRHSRMQGSCNNCIELLALYSHDQNTPVAF